MFTGIVEELGEIVAKENLTDASRFTVRGPIVTSDAVHGDSISVNGVCLTVVDILDGDSFTADVMQETLSRSSLRVLDVGTRVNLERAAALNSRLGGHLVQGHIDATGEILRRSPSDNWTVVRVALPSEIARYVVEKGSITVDGVSLTVSALGVWEAGTERSGDDWFEISLIPTTLDLTTLGSASVGDPVNLEVDVIAKYVERLYSAGR